MEMALAKEHERKSSPRDEVLLAAATINTGGVDLALDQSTITNSEQHDLDSSLVHGAAEAPSTGCIYSCGELLFVAICWVPLSSHCFAEAYSVHDCLVQRNAGRAGAVFQCVTTCALPKYAIVESRLGRTTYTQSI